MAPGRASDERLGQEQHLEVPTPGPEVPGPTLQHCSPPALRRSPEPGGAGPRPGVKGLRQHARVPGGIGGRLGERGAAAVPAPRGCGSPARHSSSSSTTQPRTAPSSAADPAPPRPASLARRPRPAWPRPHSMAAASIGLSCTWPGSHNRPNHASAVPCPRRPTWPLSRPSPTASPQHCRSHLVGPLWPHPRGLAWPYRCSPAPRRHVG